MSHKILIIDDDTDLCNVIKLVLLTDGYQVAVAHDGLAGIRQIYHYQPDLVLLDIMMPDMDGWETCQRIREMTDVPIIMMSALDRREYVVKGLDLGADDFITKPLGIEALSARVQAVLRRVARNGGEPLKDVSSVYVLGSLVIDLSRHEVTLDGQRVNLTPTEFKLLTVLARHKGRVLPHTYLLRKVWGDQNIGDMDYLRMYISYLRRKLEPDPTRPQLILTEWNVGYRLT